MAENEINISLSLSLSLSLSPSSSSSEALLHQNQEDPLIELPPVFATNDDPSPFQVTTSVFLTGAIAVFLFRALRRRAKRAKEMRFRSTGVKKTFQEEAMDSLKALSPVEEGSPPSPIQALLGGLSAGVIALLLYKFTLTVESGLNRQNISDDFSCGTDKHMYYVFLFPLWEYTVSMDKLVYEGVVSRLLDVVFEVAGLLIACFLAFEFVH